MTEVNITPETPQETQAYIDAMVAKADGKETPAATPEGTTERPAWLPEKFATPEDMAKAYAEAEKKLSGGKQEGQEAPKEEPKPEAQAEADKAAADAVSAAGLDMDALAGKIMANGDIEAADYEALAKQGITKEMVQGYVQGQQAIAEKLVTDMHASVGGQEQFDTLLGWAGDNLSPAEIEAFNNTIDTGSEAAVKLALSGLHARYNSEGGATPNLVGGKRGGTASGDVFRSTAELTKAMSDPRYSRDAAYRADVMAKLERSNIM